jgi:hypothetical protein
VRAACGPRAPGASCSTRSCCVCHLRWSQSQAGKHEASCCRRVGGAARCGHGPARSCASADANTCACNYRRAAELFGSGRKDDAVFVFYLGQLRYRAHLSARRDLKPDGDPALFASLSEVVGRPLNEYAFGDIPALARTIDAVLAYDRANPDRFTPPANFPQAYAGVRDGLASMRAQMLADADKIRATRRSNGLENRN